MILFSVFDIGLVWFDFLFFVFRVVICVVKGRFFVVFCWLFWVFFSVFCMCFISDMWEVEEVILMIWV